MRFINDDVELIHDQRVAPFLNSTIGLIYNIHKLAENCGCANPYHMAIKDSDICAQKAIKAIMNKDYIIQKDNIFGVGVENFMCNAYHGWENDIGDSKNLLGIHTFDHGLTFYGFVAGGDGQRSVFMILYHDGQNLRLYTPHWGNKLNLNRQEPLMNDGRSEKYIAKYELNKSTLGFNWNAMKIDILANFKIDYAHVMQNHLRIIEKEGE